MAHSHHMHREHQVSHRRVNKILQGEPAGAKQHNNSPAFSKVTSKTAAENHDSKVAGSRSAKRFARGGKVHSDEAEDKKLIKKMISEHDKDKDGYARGGRTKPSQTNIAIVLGGQDKKPPAMPIPIPAGPPPGGAPGGPPPGGPPMPPPGAGGPPPGMPMRARGGKVQGEATSANIGKWSKRAETNSYARGGRLPSAGAATGVGREQKASLHKGKR